MLNAMFLACVCAMFGAFQPNASLNRTHCILKHTHSIRMTESQKEFSAEEKHSLP